MKDAVLSVRKPRRIWKFAPAAIRSSIAARNANVHTGLNIKLFAPSELFFQYVVVQSRTLDATSFYLMKVKFNLQNSIKIDQD